VILTLALSLAIQAINFAAMGFGTQLYASMDSLNPPAAGSPSNIQLNMGYIVYILFAAAVSTLLYIYLLLTKLLDKSLSQSIDWCCYLIIVFFQFAIGVLFSIDLSNSSVNYSTLQSSLNLLQSMGITGQAVTNMGNYSTI
jgi:hypothetical protein